MPSNSDLRQQLRQKRIQVKPSERQQFDFLINQRLIKSNLLLRSPKIACYLANDGEPSLTLFLYAMHKHKLTGHLPVVSSNNKLKFARYNWGDPLRNNAYGIAEPTCAIHFPSRFLSIVLTPLVGFDANGNRLGMGGGYYDRTFSFIPSSKGFVRPLIIGIAYECQGVKSLSNRAWDVPLDAVVTEKKIYCFSNRSKQTLTKF